MSIVKLQEDVDAAMKRVRQKSEELAAARIQLNARRARFYSWKADHQTEESA